METKVIIIGSGAAGLMAGRILKNKGIPFVILESTDHVGGRAQTLKRENPIEFGPEFLHGNTPLTDELMEEFKLPYYDLQFDYHLYHDGKLDPLPDFWDRLCHVLDNINTKGRDISFQEYLEKFDEHSPTDQAISKVFVEGFDAADLNQVSSHTLSQMKSQACDPEMRKMRRPLHGYGELMDRLAEEILPHIYFKYRVQEIEWNKGQVTARGLYGIPELPFEVRGDKVLDTVSLSVLKEQKLMPRPKNLDKFLEQNELGQVVKIVAELDPEFFHLFKNNAFPFISAPKLNFTAWWTMTPLHTNTVTAWAGGQKARFLSNKTFNEKKELFVNELAEISFQDPDKINGWIKHLHHHDWNHDPSFLGAYSYPKVLNGEKVTPETEFEKTLYLAGEAFNEEHSGTIEGALISGKEAAEKMVS